MFRIVLKRIAISYSMFGSPYFNISFVMPSKLDAFLFCEFFKSSNKFPHVYGTWSKKQSKTES